MPRDISPATTLFSHLYIKAWSMQKSRKSRHRERTIEKADQALIWDITKEDNELGATQGLIRKTCR